MLPRTYEDQVCSIAGALGVVGDRWTLLVVRDALRGARRFDDFVEMLGVARNVLADRLNRLVAEGILERTPYQDRPVRYEYRPTAKGLELWPALMSLMLWGDRHTPSGDGPPILVTHTGCGGPLTTRLTCGDCAQSLGPENTEFRTRRSAPSSGSRTS